MISRSNKRRSKSDEGVGERTKKTQMQHSKHSNIRQARMIYPFFMMQQSSVQNFPQSVSANFNRFNSFTSMPTSMQMCSSSLPQPCVTENGICFTLFPFRNDLNYQFSIQKSPFQRVYIVSQVPLLPISFALNRCPFININLPADVTGALINGTNLISFQQINSTQPILVSLFISPSMQLNELIEKVMNDFPHAAPFNAQINNGSMNSFQNNFTLNNNNLAIHNNIILQEQNLTIIDPLTNENISHPCRGCNCCHAQCFDLTSFLMKAIGENDWCCPICQNQLTFEELRFDPNFFELLAQISHSNQIQNLNTTQFIDGNQNMDIMKNNLSELRNIQNSQNDIFENNPQEHQISHISQHQQAQQTSSHIDSSLFDEFNLFGDDFLDYHYY